MRDPYESLETTGDATEDAASGRRPLEPEIIVPWDAAEAYGDAVEAGPAPRSHWRWRLALGLFGATALSTLFVGGPLYAGAVMLILLCHEMGHFLQAQRYRVQTSLPYFIPMPLPPLGTLGAVIAMRPRSTGARGLFDIAITGPIAGLVPSLIFTVVGLPRCEILPTAEIDGQGMITLGEPLIFQWLADWLVEVPEGHTLLVGPLAFAGWVGFLVTALNLLPIGQLDGGHILYALAPRWSRLVYLGMLAAAGVAIVVAGLWHWSLIYVLLLVFGRRHPPLGWQGERLGAVRVVLGCLMLAFVIIGLSPVPLSLPEP